MNDTNENPIQEERSIEVVPSGSGKVYKPASSEADKLMSQVLNLNEKRIYHEPTCPICSSPRREDVEQDFIKNKDYDSARRLLNSDVSDAVVDNHMINHHSRSIKEIQKLEYAGKISRISKSNPSTLDKIHLCSSMILERIVEVNSLSPNSNMTIAEVEKLKSSETARLGGTLNQLMKLQASIMGEMKNSGELITIPVDEFVSVFNESLTSAKNDGERNIVKSILDKLSNINKGS